MRIIHTADWHLCNKLGPIKRTDDLNRRVERVAELCEEHAADVLIIAGDLFSEYAELEDMTKALTHIQSSFTAFFQRGGTILAITGNHDKDAKINAVHAGMTLAMPFAMQGGNLGGGRMYFLNGRGVATLASPDGQRVQFVFVPYPFTSRYDLSATVYHSKEELNNLLRAKVSEWLQKASNEKPFDASLHTVLVGHLHVRGAEVHTVYKMNAGDDVQFDLAELNPMWAYVALGHIHKPQMVNGQAHVRYPGSLDRLDFGETHEEHGVLLLEIGKSGLIGEPQHLPIPATPFHTISLTDLEAQLPGLAELYPDRETAIVRVHIAPQTTTLSRDEVNRQLKRIFPRLHELKWLESEMEMTGEIGPRIDARAGLETAVREYLTHHETFQADPDKDAVLALLETFLKDGAA